MADLNRIRQDGINGRGALRRGGTGQGEERAATTRGHTPSETLDQETAVRLEQRHPRSGHGQNGQSGRGRNGHRLEEAGVKLEDGRGAGLRLTTERGGENLGGLRCREINGRLGRGQAATRHAAAARGIAVTARLGLGHRQLNRLHLRKRRAENGEKKPGKAFHTAEGQIGFGAGLATFIPSGRF